METATKQPPTQEEIHSSQLATIAGREWGTDNKHLPDNCWSYTLWWVDQEHQLVTEEILLAWQQR